MDPSKGKPERRIAALVLAAGASTRLGHPKQLVRIAGESLLRRTARLAAEAGCAPVIVVLGSEAERMRPELEGLETLPIVNQSWPEGMGSSLRCAVEAIRPMEAVADALLLVCDQPRLSLQHLRPLLGCHRRGPSPITASVYGRRMGVPAVFAREIFAELSSMAGDHGARHLIRRHPARVTGIPWPDGDVDLDTPQDWGALRESSWPE